MCAFPIHNFSITDEKTMNFKFKTALHKTGLTKDPYCGSTPTGWYTRQQISMASLHVCYSQLHAPNSIFFKLAYDVDVDVCVNEETSVQCQCNRFSSVNGDKVSMFVCGCMSMLTGS